MTIPEADLMRRPKDLWCRACGGAFDTLGEKSHWVPHELDCPRMARYRDIQWPTQPPVSFDVEGIPRSD